MKKTVRRVSLVVMVNIRKTGDEHAAVARVEQRVQKMFDRCARGLRAVVGADYGTVTVEEDLWGSR